MYVEDYMIPLISKPYSAWVDLGDVSTPCKKWLFIWNLPVDKSDWWTTHACWWGNCSLSLGDPVLLVRCHWFGKTCLD